MSQPGFKAFAPASLSNLGSGFDLLGLALEQWGDYVIARKSMGAGVQVTGISGASSGISKDVKKNTAGHVASLMASAVGYKGGIELVIIKGYAHSSGLGSSAASAVASAIAVNALLGKPFKQKIDLLPFALAGERVNDQLLPADNVAASLLGGIILSSPRDIHSPLSLPVPQGLMLTVLKPHLQTATIAERARLDTKVLLQGHVSQSDALACLMHGLYQSNWSLISKGLKDYIIEPQRAPEIPFFYDIQNIAMENGALGCSISGSGPSLFVVSNNSLVAEKAAKECIRPWSDGGIDCDTLVSKVNCRGAKLC